MKVRHYYGHKKKDKKTMFDTTLHQTLKIVHDEPHLKKWVKSVHLFNKGQEQF